jgi:hypothetical protein
MCQTVLSQAIGWRDVTRSPLTAMKLCSTPANGERTSVGPMCPITVPTSIRQPSSKQIEGEHLFAIERLVVSPSAGVFEPAPGFADGCTIGVGTVVGHIGTTEVRSPFAGVLQSYIAVGGERVTHRQPIAWLRTV